MTATKPSAPARALTQPLPVHPLDLIPLAELVANQRALDHKYGADEVAAALLRHIEKAPGPKGRAEVSFYYGTGAYAARERWEILYVHHMARTQRRWKRARGTSLAGACLKAIEQLGLLQ